MKHLKQFFGWLFVTRSYVATLSDAQVGERALGKKGWSEFQSRQSASDEAWRRFIASLSPAAAETIH